MSCKFHGIQYDLPITMILLLSLFEVISQSNANIVNIKRDQARALPSVFHFFIDRSLSILICHFEFYDRKFSILFYFRQKRCFLLDLYLYRSLNCKITQNSVQIAVFLDLFVLLLDLISLISEHLHLNYIKCLLNCKNSNSLILIATGICFIDNS